MISANALPILLLVLSLAFVGAGVMFGCALVKLKARIERLEKNGA